MRIVRRSPYKVFTSVVSALVLREIQTRFGTKKMGYFWAIFDAMLMVLVFGGLKTAVADNSLPGVDFPVFLATGFLAYFLFLKIVNGFLGAFEANQALFSYRQVKPFDTLVSRLLVEVLVSTMATLVFIAIGWYFDFEIEVENFAMVMVAVLWLVVFAFGFGLFSAVLSTFFENYAKVVKAMLSPMLFISALMYTVESLPPVLREIILYNPLVHFIEMIHGYYFTALNTNFVDYEYMFYWTFIPFYLGLYLYSGSEKKVIAS